MARLAESVRTQFRGMREAFGSLVFAAPCRICSQILDTGNRIPFCHTCLGGLAQELREPLCDHCGRPIVSTAVVGGISKPECHLCRNRVYGFDLARSFGPYTPPMARAILLLKYGDVTPLGGWFAHLLAALAGRQAQEFAADAVVPVPLDRGRLRERGYNQADLIAKPLARLLGVPFRSYLLVRTRPRPNQLRLTRRERWETVRGAYAIQQTARVDKMRVLLVDDVFTTGATLDACSRALRRAGAARVACLTVARALPQMPTLEAGSPYQDLSE